MKKALGIMLMSLLLLSFVECAATPPPKRPHTPLGEAASEGQIDRVNALLAKGVDITEKDEGLIFSSKNGHTEIVKILLANGADANAKGVALMGSCSTILSETVMRAHVDVARVLIQNGADIDQAVACLKMEERLLAAFPNYEYIVARAASYKQALDLLEQIEERQSRAGEPAVSQALTKEQVKGMAKNRIEVATSAQKGEGEAPRITNRHGNVAGSPHNKWAVIIGIATYQYSGQAGLTNLIFADDDAKAFSDVLMSLDWNESHIRLLINEEATQRKILIALESWLTKAGPNDLIVLYWAGHGFPDPEDPEKVYFACYDTDISIPATGYRMDRVRIALQERNVRNVILLADTCHAGKLITRGDRGISIIPHIDRMNRQQEVPKGWVFMVGADT